MVRVMVLHHTAILSPRVQNEVKTLLENEFTVKILSWNRDDNRHDGENTLYVNVPSPANSIRILLVLPVVYWAIFKRLKKEVFDVIHCTHLMLLPVALCIGRLRKAKIVYDAYEMHAVDFAEYIPRFSSLLRKFVEFLENRLVAHVDGVLTIDSVGGFLTKRYQRFNANVCVLYNVPGAEPVVDPDKLERLREAYKAFQVIVYIGGIFKAKGSMQAMQALAIVKEKIPHVKLLFIGSLSDPLEEALAYVRSAHLVENVEFIPWLPYREMWLYLKIARIGLAFHQPTGRFLLVSKGNGRKFFTYMQAGLPVIGPIFSEVGQVIREEGCGVLVDTADAMQIADAVVDLLEHPDKAEAMGRRGRKAIQERYNWEVESRKLLGAYHRIIRKQ